MFSFLRLGYTGKSEPPDIGAKLPIYLATSDEVANVTGKFYSRGKIIPDTVASDPEKNNALIKRLEEITQTLAEKYGVTLPER